MSEANLKVIEVARICKCSRNTVLNYSTKGIIQPVRDLYGKRRYSVEDAERLLQILSARWPDSRPNQKPPDACLLPLPVLKSRHP